MANATTITGTYKHYKGHLYDVMGVALDTVTQGKVVLYHALYDTPNLKEEYGDKPIFTRPFDEFFSDIELDGKTMPRFELVNDKK
jgi:hypothetical protein